MPVARRPKSNSGGTTFPTAPSSATWAISYVVLVPVSLRYIQLTEVEQAFKELKSDLAIRPIYHQSDERIEAHIFVAFLAYCLQVTLKQRLRALAPGLTPRAVIEELSGIQMVDVCVPTTDGRRLLLLRYTQPVPEQQLQLQRLKWTLPAKPPPRILAGAPVRTA